METNQIDNLLDGLDVRSKHGLTHRRIGYITIPDEFTVIDGEYIQGHIMHQDFVIAPYVNMRVVCTRFSDFRDCLRHEPTPETMFALLRECVILTVYSVRHDTDYKQFIVTIGARLEGWDWRIECVAMVNKEDVK